MNIKTKNIIIIGLIIFIIYIIIISNFKENFTTEEMNKYPQMLKTNCIKSRNIYNMLRNKNKLKCNFNTNKNILNNDINITDTNKDTINNKIRCSDDINKEITAKLDTESHCVLYDKLVNKSNNSNNSNNLNNSDNSNNSNNLSTQIFKTNEGPDFINSFFIPAYDSNKISTYLSYTF
jgi:hypothetical protein